jgi:hypothetical protein
MLKAVVEEMHSGLVRGWPCAFRHCASVVSAAGDINRDSRFTCNQERLVTEFIGGSVWVNVGWELAIAAVSAGEHIHVQAALGQRLGERDGEGRLAGAAGGEIADTDDRPAETLDRFPIVLEAEVADG